MRASYGQIAACTGGALEAAAGSPDAAASRLATGLTWDSREVAPGDAFLALPGGRVDGNDFVEAALRAGASGAIVTREPSPAARELAASSGAALMRVRDAQAALTALAGWWRTRLSGRVIGLTGSCGKTTTKNLVRDVLAAAGDVVATRANQNNELGVPRTILAAAADTPAVVVEMGMRGPGQIRELCEVARPDWGIVTNVGESHIELLGSRENIAHAKAELLCALPSRRGRAFVNAADDMAPFLRAEAALSARGVATVGFDGSGSGAHCAPGEPSVWAEDVRLDAQSRPRFTLCARGLGDAAPDVVFREPCALGLRGVHNVANACCAAAVGLSLGVGLAQASAALSAARPEAGRQEVLESPRGFTVVNDAYNANPDSMRAALSTFCALSVPGRRVAVLGDMGELGDFARACHEGIGAFAAALPLDLLVCVGTLARHIAHAAAAAGMPKERIACAEGVEEALACAEAYLRPGDAVLVKASHFMELERVVEGLVA